MKIAPIDHQVHGAVALLGFVALSWAVASLNGALNQWHTGRELNKRQHQALTAIEREGAVKRANISEISKTAVHAADNHISQYNSITVTDYVCDPAQPPSFDFERMADPNQTVQVTDRNRLIVGTLSPNGSFTFTPHHCPSPH